MKRGLIFVIFFSMLTVLAGCESGQQDGVAETPVIESTDATDKDSGQQPTDTGEKAETGLTATLTERSVNGQEITFDYHVTNNSGEDLEIPFSAGGGYSYVVRKEDGTIVSENQADPTIETSQVLAEGESLSSTIILNGLPKGSYELEVWLNSDLLDKYNQTIEFTIE